MKCNWNIPFFKNLLESKTEKMMRSDFKIKYGIFWKVFPKGGGGEGSPIPKSKSKNTTQKVIFLRKTKIAPYGLKCKINHKKFSTKGFPKGGGGSAIWEKFPKNTVFF